MKMKLIVAFFNNNKIHMKFQINVEEKKSLQYLKIINK